MKMVWLVWVLPLTLSGVKSCCPIQECEDPGPGCSQPRDEAIVPTMVSAFYGLDDIPAIGFLNAGLCNGEGLSMGLTDGMPIVMSALIDPASLDASDFEVATASGSVFAPECATLEPANDDCEGRTVLLVGDFGGADSDPPKSVRVVAELLAMDGRDFQATAVPIDVTPLENGPTLVWVEQVDPLAAGAPPGAGIALRATWGGGITATNGDEVTEAEWIQYSLTYRDPDGKVRIASPIGIGDLNDGDNNHLLFFDTQGEPLVLSLPAGLVTDPNNEPNPATSQQVM